MSATVLLSGATGFIGTQVALELLKRPQTKIMALVMGADAKGAEHRARRAWWDQSALSAEIGERISLSAGDVSKERLGLCEDDHRALAKAATHIIHAAAEVRLDVPAERLRLVNVQGTANMLELAREAHRDHGLSRFTHLSTAYVAGKRTGDVAEGVLSDAAGFSSEYERSKYESEKLVRDAGQELPVTILRPGMVVGDSRTGYVRSFNTLYVPVRLYLTGQSRVLPVSPSMRVNFVPVDYVAGAVATLAFEQRSEGRTFHLTAPPERLPTVRELVAHVRDWAKRKAGMTLPRPVFLPFLPLAERGGEALGLLSPYFNENRTFLRNGTDEILGPYRLDWNEYLERLLDFALYNGFLHRSERTVHEQVFFRLGSRGRPVRLFDIVEGGMLERAAAGVQIEMLEAAAALKALGIRPGDRVAIVGLNSTRYLVLDVAIGLAGAVSVPLYYTSPPPEMDAIITASGARLLLVGAPRVLERLGKLRTEITVASFCRQRPTRPVPSPNAGRHRTFLSWEDFLAQGRGKASAAGSPVSPDDIATIRYSSGTTGKPKGVVFTHRNLRWMGEAVASLFPFEQRSREVSYLSFLPMNHVVEGILGTYSPHYAPAPLKLYFLEDFMELAGALPIARPSIFFSVPRVYEKLWQSLLSTRAGSRYARSPPGAGRRLRARLLGKPLLRRAGLDRCAQLIVGSAPCSERLIRDLRELGIEIHNAYGLTEAPLVTLNRLGQNRIGSVGRPLPETEVTTGEDGEVLVRGPQVTTGYFEKGAPQPFRDGWLLTGDIGRLDGDGFLFIEGRKGELIATAYGKKVWPANVEERLRGLPGVAEAMLAGECRPYCVALLWVKGDLSPERAAALDRAVETVNSGLAHPEQLKRWAVLAYDLAIESGELTANLKLRRQEVIRRRQDVLATLYGEAEKPASVLHIGVSGGSP